MLELQKALALTLILSVRVNTISMTFLMTNDTRLVLGARVHIKSPELVPNATIS